MVLDAVARLRHNPSVPEEVKKLLRRYPLSFCLFYTFNPVDLETAKHSLETLGRLHVVKKPTRVDWASRLYRFSTGLDQSRPQISFAVDGPPSLGLPDGRRPPWYRSRECFDFLETRDLCDTAYSRSRISCPATFPPSQNKINNSENQRMHIWPRMCRTEHWEPNIARVYHQGSVKSTQDACGLWSPADSGIATEDRSRQ